MSTALNYQEPYRFSAGLLALAVHLAFFSLLYFGVHWQSHEPEVFSVEMWDNMPNVEIAPAPAPPPPPPVKIEPIVPPKVVAPVLPSVKPDIEIRDKKGKKVVVKEKPAKRDEAKEKAAAKARAEAELKELEAYSDRQRKVEQERIQAEQARIRAEVNMATKVQVERYQDLIRSKIRRKIATVADVPATAEAIFKITLLPDGTLLDDPVLIKSSGIPAYDDAVARAILLAQPLPLPADVSLQRMFRELKLSFKP